MVTDRNLSIGIRRIMAYCRRHRIAPGDRFPAQETWRNQMGLSNRVASAAMALLTDSAVVRRKQRAGTTLLDYQALPPGCTQIGIVTVATADQTIATSTATVFMGIVNALSARGFPLRIYPVSHPRRWVHATMPDLGGGLQDDVEDHQIDGLVTPLVHVHGDHVDWLEAHDCPVVYCGTGDSCPSGVLIDHRAFAREAVQALVAGGSRRLVLVHHDGPKHGSTDGWEGFRQGVADSGATSAGSGLVTSDLVPGRAGGVAVAQKLLAMPESERPEGLVILDDWLALGIQHGLRGSGWRPAMAVQGNSELPMPFLWPVVARDVGLSAMATAAVDLLLGRLFTPWEDHPVRRVIPAAPGDAA